MKDSYSIHTVRAAGPEAQADNASKELIGSSTSRTVRCVFACRFLFVPFFSKVVMGKRLHPPKAANDERMSAPRH